MSQMFSPGAEEHTLPYFHGALMDQDVDTFLQAEGDFLLQTKHVNGATKPRLTLAVKKGSDVRRFPVMRSEDQQVKIGKNKAYTSLKKMIECYQRDGIQAGGDTIHLKKPVAKGKFQLVHSDIKLLKKIGSGAYGTVYRGILMRDNRIVAVKRIDSDSTDEQGLAEMMKEARVMQLYDHKNIVKFYGFIVDRTPYLLVMEYCEGGSVEDKLREKEKRYTTNHRVDMSYQAATGLEYLHSKECIHRDIAARNCLIHYGTVKLADFGMCRATSVYKVDLSKPLNVRWLAPEVWRIGETRYNTDIYAFGIMMWEFFKTPYTSPYIEWKAGTVKSKVMGGYRLPPPSNMPSEIAEVMELAWNHDPEKRPDSKGLRVLLEDVAKGGAITFTLNSSLTLAFSHDVVKLQIDQLEKRGKYPIEEPPSSDHPSKNKKRARG